MEEPKFEGEPLFKHGKIDYYGAVSFQDMWQRRRLISTEQVFSVQLIDVNVILGLQMAWSDTCEYRVSNLELTRSLTTLCFNDATSRRRRQVIEGPVLCCFKLFTRHPIDYPRGQEYGQDELTQHNEKLYIYLDELKDLLTEHDEPASLLNMCQYYRYCGLKRRYGQREPDFHTKSVYMQTIGVKTTLYPDSMFFCKSIQYVHVLNDYVIERLHLAPNFAGRPKRRNARRELNPRSLVDNSGSESSSSVLSYTDRSFSNTSLLQNQVDMNPLQTNLSGEEYDYYTIQLISYMRDLGECMTLLPCLGGESLDFHDLQKRVKIRGGYKSVCRLGMWPAILKCMEMEKHCYLKSDINIKKIYEKYVKPYHEFLHPDQKCDIIKLPKRRETSLTPTGDEVSTSPRPVTLALSHPKVAINHAQALSRKTLQPLVKTSTSRVEADPPKSPLGRRGRTEEEDEEEAELSSPSRISRDADPPEAAPGPDTIVPLFAGSIFAATLRISAPPTVYGPPRYMDRRLKAAPMPAAGGNAGNLAQNRCFTPPQVCALDLSRSNQEPPPQLTAPFDLRIHNRPDRSEVCNDHLKSCHPSENKYLYLAYGHR